jgi:hypothetical protein
MIQRGKGLALQKQARRLGAPGGVAQEAGHGNRGSPRLVAGDDFPPRAVHKAAMLTLPLPQPQPQGKAAPAAAGGTSFGVNTGQPKKPQSTSSR